MISKAQGFLGSCEEYLNFTITSLKELDITDKKMEKIFNLIKNK